MRIFSEANKLFASVNGKLGPPEGIVPIANRIDISHIGGGPGGNGAFQGTLFDLSIRDDNGPLAAYSGDVQDSVFGPWEDMSGNGNDGEVIDTGN